MANEITMNMPRMEDMLYAIGDAIDKLEVCNSEVSSISTMLSDGALLGRSGEMLEEACRQTLTGRIQALNDMLIDLCKDVSGAMEDMLEADSASRGAFNPSAGGMQ